MTFPSSSEGNAIIFFQQIEPTYRRYDPVYNQNDCYASGEYTYTIYYVCCSRQKSGTWQYRLKRRRPQEGDDELSEDELFVNGAEGYVDEEDLEFAHQPV